MKAWKQKAILSVYYSTKSFEYNILEWIKTSNNKYYALFLKWLIKLRYKNPILDSYYSSNFIFIHIPKTWWLAIQKSICANNDVLDWKWVVGHKPISLFQVFDEKFVEKTFKFALVREPIDRFTSSYNFLKEGWISGLDRMFSDIFLKDVKDINDFIVKIKQNNSYWKKVLNYIHFLPQSFFVKWLDNKIIVDIYPFHDFETSFNYITKKVWVEAQLNSVNRTKQKEDSIISDENIKYLNEIYNDDINFFKEFL